MPTPEPPVATSGGCCPCGPCACYFPDGCLTIYDLQVPTRDVTGAYGYVSEPGPRRFRTRGVNTPPVVIGGVQFPRTGSSRWAYDQEGSDPDYPGDGYPTSSILFAAVTCVGDHLSLNVSVFSPVSVGPVACSFALDDYFCGPRNDDYLQWASSGPIGTPNVGTPGVTPTNCYVSRVTFTRGGC